MAAKKDTRIKRVRPGSDDETFIDWDGVFDPGEYLENLIRTSVDQRALDDIDEREIPRAANFAEFCYGTSFNNFPAYPRALQYASQFFGEMCYFCSDQSWMDNLFDQEFGEINEHIVFTRHGICPTCGRTQHDFVRQRRWQFPNRFVAIIGQRAGKNIMAVQMAQYQLHRILTLELDGKRVLPHKFYNVAPPLTMTFTAVTLGQAMKNIWGPWSGIYEDSPWFQEYAKFLKYHGQRKGVELYVDNNTFLSFRNKKVDVACRAPDQRTLRGATRFWFTIDEVSWMDAGESSSENRSKNNKVLGSSDEIWIALANSLKSVRQNALLRFKGDPKNGVAGIVDVPTGCSCDTSSPCHVNDKGMRDLRESQVNPSIHAHNCATWDFNPTYSGGIADFAEEYASNALEAERNFGAIPPLTMDPWIAANERGPVILACRPIAERSILSYTRMEETNPFGETTIWFKLDGVADASTPRLIAVDNGLSNNAFALVIGSLDSGKPRIDECFMLKPDERRRIKINLEKMFTDFVYPLSCRLNVVAGFYDHWASSQHIQRFRDEGKDWRQYAPTPANFDSIRGRLQSGDISLPNSEYDPNVFLGNDAGNVDLVRQSWTKPNFGLLLQILTVRQLGKRLYKPLAGDDDVFRAAALVMIHLYDEELRKKLGFAKRNTMQTTGGALIASRGRSSGGGAATGPTGFSSQSIAVARRRTR